MATTTALTENSRQGINLQIPHCIGLDARLSPNLRPGCGHAYDETPVGLVVYVRNDPVNKVDPDGREWMYLLSIDITADFQLRMSLTPIWNISVSSYAPGGFNWDLAQLYYVDSMYATGWGGGSGGYGGIVSKALSDAEKAEKMAVIVQARNAALPILLKDDCQKFLVQLQSLMPNSRQQRGIVGQILRSSGLARGGGNVIFDPQPMYDGIASAHTALPFRISFYREFFEKENETQRAQTFIGEMVHIVTQWNDSDFARKLPGYEKGTDSSVFFHTELEKHCK